MQNTPITILQHQLQVYIDFREQVERPHLKEQLTTKIAEFEAAIQLLKDSSYICGNCNPESKNCTGYCLGADQPVCQPLEAPEEEYKPAFPEMYQPSDSEPLGAWSSSEIRDLLTGN